MSSLFKSETSHRIATIRSLCPRNRLKAISASVESSESNEEVDETQNRPEIFFFVYRPVLETHLPARHSSAPNVADQNTWVSAWDGATSVDLPESISPSYFGLW